MTLGEALGDEIERRRLTQDEAGDLLGTSGSTVNRWIYVESVPTPEFLEPLRAFLDASEEQFALYFLLHALRYGELHPRRQ